MLDYTFKRVSAPLKFISSVPGTSQAPKWIQSYHVQLPCLSLGGQGQPRTRVLVSTTQLIGS